VWFLVDDLIYRFKEVVVDLLVPEIHPALGIEAVERSQTSVGVGDLDDVH